MAVNRPSLEAALFCRDDTADQRMALNRHHAVRRAGRH
jgi:hypothetical protein